MKFKPVLLHFKFDNFADLPCANDSHVYSEDLTDCNGHKWQLSLYPGGEFWYPGVKPRNKDSGWVGLYLLNRNTGMMLDTKFTLSVKDAEGRTTIEHNVDDKYFQHQRYDGARELMKRKDILDTTKHILRDGALHVDVTIQVKAQYIDVVIKDEHYEDKLFQPPSERSNKLLNLLTTGEMSDTSLHVGGKLFNLHSFILHVHAPLLANHCDGVIDNISPEVFQLILEHVYCGRQPENEDIFKHGKELINASNRYELIELKMAVENVLVRERVMTKENVSDYIVFADAQSCALLKEYAISFFSTHYREVIKSEHSKCLRDSGQLLSEIMMPILSGNEDGDTMTVNELRKELCKRKLDVDGSKDALVARLEEAKRQRSD